MKRRPKNPHAELCAWANGLRPDSPRYTDEEPAMLNEESTKRAEVLSAIKSSAARGNLGVTSAMSAVPEHLLADCARNDSLGVLTQDQIDMLWLDVVP